MKIEKRNRAELKSYFVKNAMPTESNFAELIEGALNQKDDGIVKIPGDPLSIEASGDATSTKRALDLYSSFSNPNPDWTINLNPRSDPKDTKTARLGFNLSDGEGNSRFFIDRNTRSVGIGTTEPHAPLEVMQSVGGISTGLQFRGQHTPGVTAGGVIDSCDAYGSSVIRALTLQMNGGNVGIGETNPSAKLQVKGGNIQLDGGQQIKFTDVDETNNLKLQLWSGYGLGINAGALFYAAYGKHSWRDTNGTNERMVLTTGADGGLTVSGTGNSSFAGNVGIGTTPTGAKLDIKASNRTTGTWFEAIRFSQTEHSAITHPGGGLLFGLHGNRNFYFSDIKGDVQKIIMTINAATGNVGIGSDAPLVPLHISGGVERKWDKTTKEIFGLYVEQNAAALKWHTISDARVKLNPTPVDPGCSLKTLMDLTVYEYEHIPEYQSSSSSRKYHGFLAQEVEKVIPGAISIVGDQRLGEDRVIEGLRVVANDHIFCETVGAIQALFTMLQKQEGRICALEGQRSVVRSDRVK